MADVDAVKVILNRERGYQPAVVKGNGISTAVACRLLNLSPKDLLALRRRLLERTLGKLPLPPLTYAEVETALLSETKNAC